MNAKFISILVASVVLLAGCAVQPMTYSRGHSSSGWGYQHDITRAVENAEELRTRVLHSSPEGGVWDPGSRIFDNRVSVGVDARGGERQEFRLTGQGRGTIP